MIFFFFFCPHKCFIVTEFCHGSRMLFSVISLQMHHTRDPHMYWCTVTPPLSGYWLGGDVVPRCCCTSHRLLTCNLLRMSTSSMTKRKQMERLVMVFQGFQRMVTFGINPFVPASNCFHQLHSVSLNFSWGVSGCLVMASCPACCPAFCPVLDTDSRFTTTLYSTSDLED